MELDVSKVHTPHLLNLEQNCPGDIIHIFGAAK